MIVLVCGGRDYRNRQRVFDVLDSLRIDVVLQGGAAGTDMLAADWAAWKELPCIRHPARWKLYKNGAGPVRNAAMLDQWPVDLCVAFPGGTGTADMVNKARTAGITVENVT